MREIPLFAGIEEGELSALLGCLNARERAVTKDELIFAAGTLPEYVGIVLEGCVHVVQEDYWGRRSILASVQPGGLFGEAFSCAESGPLPISAFARETGRVLLADCKRILTTCPSSCLFHTRLIRNLIKIMAENNILLTRKIEHISKKSTRERVLSYLSECALAEGADSFAIPFNRQELADYLSVERSALSGTLGRMRDEGIISFEKNFFTLQKSGEEQ